VSQLSGRSLNYAFQSRFNCSPQEWQRNFLLDEARRLLTTPENNASIKNVSYELGFSSASSFASHYKKRFGESPSETAGKFSVLRKTQSDEGNSFS
jgi:AraC family ethanolamine operon transcriptional activator